MAYSKLTASFIDALISELRVATRSRGKFMSVGLPMHLLSVRYICTKAGISHTTFYRWLRVYGSLKQRKERLTASEKLLCQFGRAVEAYIAVDSSAKTVGGKPLLILKPSRPPRRNVASTPAHPDLSAIEARTDTLVREVGGVDLKFPQFSLKNK